MNRYLRKIIKWTWTHASDVTYYRNTSGEWQVNVIRYNEMYHCNNANAKAKWKELKNYDRDVRKSQHAYLKSLKEDN